MDTAQPGLLRDWDRFKEQYVLPITSADRESKPLVRKEVGEKLRADVGQFMLRRLKEDNLKGLPEKRIYTGPPRLVVGLDVPGAIGAGNECAAAQELRQCSEGLSSVVVK